MKKIMLMMIMVAMAFGIVPALNATILSLDLFTENDNYLTRDSTTGLDWLDLSLTQGRSYSDVMDGYGGYTTTLGFRYATFQEVSELVVNSGYTIPIQFPIPNGTNYGTDQDNYSILSELISSLGITSYTFSTAPTSAGLTSTAVPLFDPLAGDTEGRLGIYLQVGPHPTRGEFYSVLSNSGYFSESTETSWQGSFLVKDQFLSVPVPSTILLFSIGLLGLTTIRSTMARHT